MDNPKPLPQPHATTSGTAPTTNNHALENLKSLIMKCAIASTPAESLTPSLETFIEKRVQAFLTTIHTPDHPPYAWMIENAIKELNEEGGSTEEAISKFILQEYEDLPWGHVALLKHHLRQLSESGNLIESHNGCYLIGNATTSHRRTPKPSLRSTCTTSRSLSPSPDPNASPSSSFPPTYASSSTSSSSQSFSLKWKGRKKKRKFERRKQNARGTKILPKYKDGRGRGRGRSRGRGQSQGRDWSYDDTCEENTQYLMIEDEAVDENIQGKEQSQERGTQDYVDVEIQAQEGMVIEIEPPEHIYKVGEERNIEPLQHDAVNNCSTPSTIPKLISEQASKKVWHLKRNIHLRHTSQTSTGRPRKRDMHLRETGKNMEPLEATEMGALELEDERNMQEQSEQMEYYSYHSKIEVCSLNDDYMGREIQFVDQEEQDEGDSLDEIIEEVYTELKEATERQHSMIDVEVVYGNFQRKEHHQVQENKVSVNVECHAEPNTMISEIGTQQEHIVGEDTIEMDHQNAFGGNSSSRPQTTRGRGRPLKREMHMEEPEKISEPPDITEIGDLIREIELETGESNLTMERQTKFIEMRAHTEEMQNKINQQSAADQTYKITDLEPEEQVCKFPENPNEQQS